MVTINERFRIIFTIQIPTKDYLVLLGVDYNNACLFSVMIYCNGEQIDLEHKTSHYPSELMNFLKQNKQLIESGFFHVRTWEITFYDSLKESKVFEMPESKDRGMKKWQPFFLPGQSEMIQQMYENDKKVSKPIVDDYELELINQKIMDSLENEQPLMLQLYESGYLKEVGGVVLKVDPYTKTIRIGDSKGSFVTVKFVQIVGCEAI